MNDVNILDEISDFIFISKYARYNVSKKRRETWEECVERVRDMHLTKFSGLSEANIKDINTAFEYVKDKKIVPSMRSLQFGGDAVLAHNPRLYNCLSEETEFVTSEGVKSFKDFSDGDKIMVLSHTGKYQKATVKFYGKDYLNEIEIKKGKNTSYIKATKDHTWFLRDGSQTENIKSGQQLLGSKDIFSEFYFDSASVEEKLYWCYGFVYGDGTVTKNKSGKYSLVRLCGGDIKYKNRFEELGFKTSTSLSCGGDYYAYTGKYQKTPPDPSVDSPELIRAFVAGYLDADGEKSDRRSPNKFLTIQSSQKDHIEFIRKCFPIAGVFIISETELTGQETNYGIRPYTISFRVCNYYNSGELFIPGSHFRVTNISQGVKKENVWCLEVENDKSFVLKNGLVTGNCAVRHVDSFRAFAEIFYLLLCGTGVGIGLSKYFLSELPDIIFKTDMSGTVLNYTIQDNIEGWADSIEVLLMCYFRNTAFTGRKIVFDYSKIRREGEPLKTGGGKAPGYKGLKRCHDKIISFLDALVENEQATRLKPIHAYDILMCSADAVLSGGIRRSACSVIFDLDDNEMMEAKTYFDVSSYKRFVLDEEDNKYHGIVYVNGKKHVVALNEMDYEYLKTNKKISWFYIEPQRARSNNSVLLNRETVTQKQFMDIVNKSKQFGEPGFVFSSDKKQLLNPCVTGDTKIFTKEGITTIEDLVEKTVEIWNGFEWSTVIPKVTGYYQRIYEVKLADGRRLKCTPNHRFMVVKDNDERTVTTLELHSLVEMKCEDWYVVPYKDPLGVPVQGSTVCSVKFIGFAEKVYCFKDHLRGYGVFNGILTHQCFEISFIPTLDNGQCGVQFCNLSSINGAKIEKKSDFINACKYASLLGTLQATYTHFPYLNNASKKLTEEEALLGVSITGIMDSPSILLNEDYLQEGAHKATITNRKWAKILGINPAARVTCLKPEGTSSLVLGAASGIHPHHSQKYIRRVQVNRLENPFKYLKKLNPHACELSVWSANKTDEVVSFPIEIRDNAVFKKDLSAIKHLEIIKLVQENWVNAGTSNTNKKPIHHSVSCTVIVKSDEWDVVCEYLYKNRDHFTAVALLADTGDKDYQQAPLQAVKTKEDEEHFNILKDKWKHVDFTKLVENEDLTEMQQTIACGGGKCEIV